MEDREVVSPEENKEMPGRKEVLCVNIFAGD